MKNQTASDATRRDSSDSWQSLEAFDDDFKPLTAEQAQAWRLTHRAVSVWRILLLQAATGLVLALVAGAWTQSVQVAWSSLLGMVAVVVPGAVFAWGLQQQMRGPAQVGQALKGLMVWELAKIGLTTVLLAVAPWLVPGLSWLALLACFVVTMKVSWLAMWLQPKRG